ncbi:baseplate wedge protein [Mycobacterium phage ScoobyDoobyDoo]|nr:baseplate wedge protein [Mycobacterium phage ScoobyDoobyDoo]
MAEAISEAYVDQYLVGSLLDIEAKAGLELEQWVGIFGFGRLQGRQATGVVRVELANANAQDIPIAQGTQFYTRQGLPGTNSQLYFSSTQAVVIPAGSYVADIPVQCTVVGSAGNVPPDSIVYLGSIIGATSVTNLTALTGGVDVETDAELRQRFKDTFMRNIAGTEDWYLGLAYQNKNVSKAVCFGPIRKYVTQVAVPDTTLNLPVTNDVKYAWPKGEVVFKNLGQADEVFYRPGDDYTFTSGSSPQITRISTGEMVVGDIVDVEFEYTTRASRNNPQAGITNKVDLFVNGADPYTITERTVVSATTLSSNSADELYTGNFARVGSSGTPSASNRFMRLGSVPILTFPSSIVVGSTNYQQGVHYHLLRGTTLDAGSPREVAGIEWLAAGPSSDTPLTLTYVYNRVPEVLNAVVKQGKQITTDVLVHQAGYAYLKIYLSIEFDRGFVVSQVTNAIQERLRQYFAGLPFGSWIELSDLNLAVHQVLGVDNVWVTTSTENPTKYGIEVYGAANDTTPSSIQTTDFKLSDNTLPVFLEAVVLRKANR